MFGPKQKSLQCPMPSRNNICNSVLATRWHGGKESACQCRTFKRQGFNIWVGKIF